MSESHRDELRVELRGVMTTRSGHVYRVNETAARALCGAYTWNTDTFDRALETRPVDGYEDRVECGNCRRILGLGAKP